MKKIKAKLIYPSSYICYCGHEIDFFENTVREAKEMSKKREIHLSADMTHTVVFYKKEAIKIICPEYGEIEIEP